MKFEYKEGTLGYSILKKSDLEAMHEATLNLMEDYGVAVFGDEPQGILSGAGCTVDKETNMVKFPRNVVNDCIASAPSEYMLYGRDPDDRSKDVKIAVGEVTFTTFGTGVMVIDPYTGERRESTLEDVKNIIRFADAVPEVDSITLPVAATDVAEEIKELYEAEALFANTSKPLGHDAEGGENTRRVIQMAAAIAGGAEALRQRPTMCMGACPNSPLELHESAAEQIIECAKAGIPMDVLSMGLCGGSTPVTLAGTLLTTNCEVLSGIILGQLTKKGAPMVYGSSTTIMDLKLTTSPVGAPEHAMVGAAVAEIGKYYGIPTDVGGT
jgi:trimethylamine--corrinoid protein Co-methyltransferase